MSKIIPIVNVFKDGKNKTSKVEFTKKWIELVNQMEKNNR